LCSMVEVDAGDSAALQDRKLWTRTTAGSGSLPSWSLRCRFNLQSLPRTIRNSLPLASSSGGKILLATSCHEVYACDPESSSAERVFSMEDFVD
ncbi:hypothetical protein BAE44_0010970, partial [Dichanthelium oligosanthes]